MIFDGMRFRRRYDLQFRYTTEGDKYVDGSPMNHRAAYVVFFKKQSGKAVPLTGHGLTNKAFGVEKVVKGRRQNTIYLALDGLVYSTTFKRES